MRTDDLIHELSVDLKSVKPLATPMRMTVIFVVFGLALLGVCFLIMQSRADLKDHLVKPIFLLETSLSFLLGLVALAWSSFLIRPGQEVKAKKLSGATLAILFCTLSLSAFEVVLMEPSQIQTGLNSAGIHCFMNVVVYGLLLGAVCMYWLRKGASMNSRLSGFAIGIACLGFGSLAIGFFCGVDNGMHIFMWHFLLPMGGLLFCGIATARYSLRW